MGALFVTYFISGVIFALLAIPLMQDRIPPNSWYGFRVKRTLENPDLWYPVNRYSGVRLFWSGVLTALVSVVLFLIPDMNADLYSLICLAVLCGSLFIGFFQSISYLNRIADERHSH